MANRQLKQPAYRCRNGFASLPMEVRIGRSGIGALRVNGGGVGEGLNGWTGDSVHGGVQRLEGINKMITEAINNAGPTSPVVRTHLLRLMTQYSS